jgi:hypothetical protein
VFGILIFLSVAVIFYSSVANTIFSPASTTPTSSSVGPFVYIAPLYFILPFALAYDGYHRAKQV